MGWRISAVLLLAVTYFGFDGLALAPRRDAALVAQTTEQVTAVASAQKSKVDPRSIAVLPFVNMSTDAENEFFADGLTEELSTDLARGRALRVISRTSSMQFKGTTKGIRTIGRELGVRYVLEGSVRRAGNSLRITAQLIDAANDAPLWGDPLRTHWYVARMTARTSKPGLS